MAERHRAFGLELDGALVLPGTQSAAAGRPARPFTLDPAPRERVLEQWPAAGAADVSRRRSPSGRTVSLIASHPSAGLLLRADGYGAYRIDAAARRADCGLLRSAPAWRWQRFVTAQVLPFAAILHGIEGLHAGAVALGGRAVAVAAGSGGGKSTLVAALVARGAPLVADDVVALEPGGDGLVAHPGPGALSLRPASRRLLGGAFTGSDGPAPLLVAREDSSLQLGALVLLRRGNGARRVAIERVKPDPRELLGATFNAAWRTRSRLERQLEVCALLARAVPVLRLTAPERATPDELAHAVERATG